MDDILHSHVTLTLAFASESTYRGKSISHHCFQALWKNAWLFMLPVGKYISPDSDVNIGENARVLSDWKVNSDNASEELDKMIQLYICIRSSEETDDPDPYLVELFGEDTNDSQVLYLFSHCPFTDAHCLISQSRKRPDDSTRQRVWNRRIVHVHASREGTLSCIYKPTDNNPTLRCHTDVLVQYAHDKNGQSCTYFRIGANSRKHLEADQRLHATLFSSTGNNMTYTFNQSHLQTLCINDIGVQKCAGTCSIGECTKEIVVVVNLFSKADNKFEASILAIVPDKTQNKTDTSFSVNVYKLEYKVEHVSSRRVQNNNANTILLTTPHGFVELWVTY